MRTVLSLVTMGVLAAAVGAPAWAGDRHDGDRQQRQRAVAQRCAGDPGQGMQAIVNAAGAQERAHGWQYFSDPAACRAVVISPQGDYYLSRGKGLRWVASAQSGI